MLEIYYDIALMFIRAENLEALASYYMLRSQQKDQCASPDAFDLVPITAFS